MQGARVDPERHRRINEGREGDGPVIYWMSRDQRAHDNWALLHAQDLALARERPLVVAFCLAPAFLGAAVRQYAFMLRGLRETAEALRDHNVAFKLLRGGPGEEVAALADEVDALHVVTDADPLGIKVAWREDMVAATGRPVTVVDAHNVVPVWVASDKRDWAAYTIRPKIHRQLPRFLTDLPTLLEHPLSWDDGEEEVDPTSLLGSLDLDTSVPEVDRPSPGPRAGTETLSGFIDQRLDAYDEARNDPSVDGTSRLSPYLHFGQLSPQRAAWEAQQADLGGTEAFIEEAVVRRELADNFCHYEPRYASTGAFPDWARTTLEDHLADPRERIYDPEELEEGRTDDELWNAAQRQMVSTGWMHGYMRMYWAKRLLVWTPTPEDAMAIAIRLNDRYQLDGRDPNGYTGIAWSIGGVHDRAWGPRPVFGKVRSMSPTATPRKFDSRTYVDRFSR
ncbi:MAG: deoxyribodipyrimidine photo-lyase [Thermoplasmata archaeon]|nr:deoxyribodipyrimidine photo-lyase [Thermoplasmata archaeon]NIS11377.1 deoxyribodipyrimidine photo-lyase [Thermoplasmata archaeon]NIS19914.1 deoxyribodipyrimidine photo-lyase [Thermoplasmata archaeon]NIT76404.1 deoxyribodipyrimidine photo-lyase [Thermoplasmata archaeon]NIU49021.1 deoxyribodipyrimidine photo-lyase [Thermoplasmata archaeon]